MKNITLSADENLIEKARETARAQNRTLNDAFREWLLQFTNQPTKGEQYDAIMAELRKTVRLHPPYTRDELNER